jgi:uncharacterized Tic20 family protein
MDPLQQPPAASDNFRMWTVLCHASALLGLLIPGVANVLPPLIVWLVKRADSAEVDAHGKESLNFQLSMLIYALIAGVLTLVLIGFVLLPILYIVNAVLVILASLRASEGQLYRYPLTIRFLK